MSLTASKISHWDWGNTITYNFGHITSTSVYSGVWNWGFVKQPYEIEPIRG